MREWKKRLGHRLIVRGKVNESSIVIVLYGYILPPALSVLRYIDLADLTQNFPN